MRNSLSNYVGDGNEPQRRKSTEDKQRILVGICAMKKKTASKPMSELINRFNKIQLIYVVIFDEDIILNEPIDKWPVVDCLISFYSEGFPLEKAIRYAKLRRPFLINDLQTQVDLQDRTKVYQILNDNNIDTPKYIVCNRSKGPVQFEENDDHVEINGETIHKPFVEKPIYAEDHNINIYYPASAGGGHQKLFRKIKNTSSKYCQG